MNHPKSIFIIDDDRIYQLVMAKTMQRLDASVQVNSYLDGSDALEAIAGNLAKGVPLPELIFLDINMPNMDGWDFLDRFLGLVPEPATRIYLTSSSVAFEDKHKAMLYPSIKQFLIKPIPKETLIEVMKTIL